MMQRYDVIDRFEGDVAVLVAEDATTYDLPRAALPPGAKVGDWLQKQADGSHQIDAEKTKQRQTEMRARLDALLNRK